MTQRTLVKSDKPSTATPTKPKRQEVEKESRSPNPSQEPPESSPASHTDQEFQDKPDDTSEQKDASEKEAQTTQRINSGLDFSISSIVSTSPVLMVLKNSCVLLMVLILFVKVSFSFSVFFSLAWSAFHHRVRSLDEY